MGLYPPSNAELWHVSRVPDDHLDDSMASIVQVVDDPKDSYTMPLDARIDSDGYLRAIRETGPDQYLPMEDVRLEGER